MNGRIENQSNELNVGRAGEYLVMVDLISKGFKCFLTDQGINYDIVVDYNGRLIKLQVKATQRPRILQQRYVTPVYQFGIRRAGKGGKRQYDPKEFDGFALAVLDVRQVGYMFFREKMNRTVLVRDCRQREKYQQKGKRASYLDEITFERFLIDYEKSTKQNTVL